MHIRNVAIALIFGWGLSTSAFANDYWLVYDQRINEKGDPTLQYEYIGFLSLPPETTQDNLHKSAKCLAKKYSHLEFKDDNDCQSSKKQFPKVDIETSHRKPIVTKKDNARILVLGLNSLACKITENSFAATDAAVVPATAPKADTAKNVQAASALTTNPANKNFLMEVPGLSIADQTALEAEIAAIKSKAAEATATASLLLKQLPLEDGQPSLSQQEFEVKLKNIRDQLETVPSKLDSVQGKLTSVADSEQRKTLESQIVDSRHSISEALTHLSAAKNRVELLAQKSIWACDLHTLLKGGIKIGYQIAIAPKTGTSSTAQTLSLPDILSGLEKSATLLNNTKVSGIPADTDPTSGKIIRKSPQDEIIDTIRSLSGHLKTAAEKPGQKPTGEDKPGGTATPTSTATKDTSTPSKDSVIDDEMIVRDLYRFRIIAGPVYSSLAAGNETFSTITNVNGQHVITSSRKNDSPVNYPVFLKVYWYERDILECVSCEFIDSVKAPFGPKYLESVLYSFARTISPVVGISMVDSPLKNFYAGLSIETFKGVDIVAGAHISKVNHLDGGFQNGQIVTNTAAPPQSEKLSVGGFAGITVDIGVVGSWLGAGIAKGIRDGFK